MCGEEASLGKEIGRWLEPLAICVRMYQPRGHGNRGGFARFSGWMGEGVLRKPGVW